MIWFLAVCFTPFYGVLVRLPFFLRRRTLLFVLFCVPSRGAKPVVPSKPFHSSMFTFVFILSLQYVDIHLMSLICLSLRPLRDFLPYTVLCRSPLFRHHLSECVRNWRHCDRDDNSRVGACSGEVPIYCGTAISSLSRPILSYAIQHLRAPVTSRPVVTPFITYFSRAYAEHGERRCDTFQGHQN